MSELITMKNKDEIDSKKIKSSKKYLNHTIYEWINLLSTFFVPLVVGILTVVLPLQQQNLSDRQNENSKTIALNGRLQDIELVHDQQRQIILNTYEHDLSELVLQYNFLNVSYDVSNDDTKNYDDTRRSQDKYDDECISLIIRMKTLHALRQLDPVRKTLLIQLLIDSGIQQRINISQADLSSLVFPPGSFYNQLRFLNIIARNISLKQVSLHQSNFSYSILDESTFQESNCSYSDFSYTSLQRTNWKNTDVTQVVFNYTNLLGATITSYQLSTVKSLTGATLPNGSIVAI